MEKKKKTMTAILGSPHENGATAAMLNCAVSAARADGWEVTVISLYQKQISFCRGCRACMKAKECIMQDDIGEIAALLKTSDLVVLASPVYWANVPATVKNMFDRLLGTAMEETAAFPKPRLSSSQKYLLLTACNTPFPFSWLFGQSRGAVRAMTEFFKTAGMKKLGCVVYPNAKGNPSLPHRVVKKIGRLCEKGL